ncbi:hypothetical protein [Atlantibacter hermannii]|uniref:hypothetical protein n=1 Tax=Atlantibacter hermannii TaxID=565 RepID=UPI00296EC66F|nr:hypothetical protein [Atlantibacter hermannii]MDW4578493.1 hypothetical protein [Atlantibacter hermannii]
MSKIVALIAAEEKGKKPSIRKRKLKARIGLRRTHRMTNFDALAKKLGYQIVRGTHVVFRYPPATDVLKDAGSAEAGNVPRVKALSFTEACKISRDLSDAREERLKSACFDGPE